ncbi:MAG: hypothetical protein R2707_17305 [Acidimicrobiales bacterium]
MQSNTCSICGKSTFDEVAAPPPAAKPRWSDSLNNELRKVGTALFAIALLAAGTAFVLTRPDTAPSATALPPPVSTTSAVPLPTTSERPPSLVGGARPTSGFLPGVPREVAEALSPWDTPPPVDLVSGLLLDESLDYADDIARVAELLADFPDEFVLAPLDPPEILTFDGVLDADQLEATQPFAARTLQRTAGSTPGASTLGEVWLIASGGSTAGDAYLAAARERWNREAAIDLFSPEVGLRLWLLGSDGTTDLWVSDLDDDAMILVQAPTTADPAALADVLDTWRHTQL